MMIFVTPNATAGVIAAVTIGDKAPVMRAATKDTTLAVREMARAMKDDG